MRQPSFIVSTIEDMMQDSSQKILDLSYYKNQKNEHNSCKKMFIFKNSE